jgi:hypothetical protein
MSHAPLAPARRRGRAEDKALRPVAERKFAPGLIAPVGLDGAFSGYASLFGVVDLGRDLVMAGAFRDTLDRRGPRGVKMLWQHDPRQPIGVWEVIEEDSRGLFVAGRLDLAVAKAREAHALMRSKAVDGLSIGFRTERARTEPCSGIRRIERLDLWEISVVTFPMLPGARVAHVKQARAGLPRAADPFAASLRRAAAALAHRRVSFRPH